MQRLVLVVAAIVCMAMAGSGQSKQRLNLIKEGVGVDGIAVGISTSEDVIKKYGNVYLWEKNKTYSFQMTYLDRGLSFYMCQSDKKEVIFLIEIKPPFQGKTGKGIVLGNSTRGETEKAYGLPHDGSESTGIGFFFDKRGKREVVSEIDILESTGIRQCDAAK